MWYLECRLSHAYTKLFWYVEIFCTALQFTVHFGQFQIDHSVCDVKILPHCDFLELALIDGSRTLCINLYSGKAFRMNLQLARGFVCGHMGNLLHK